MLIPPKDPLLYRFLQLFPQFTIFNDRQPVYIMFHHHGGSILKIIIRGYCMNCPCHDIFHRAKLQVLEEFLVSSSFTRLRIGISIISNGWGAIII